MTETEKYLDYLKMLRRPFQKLCRLRFLQPDGSTAFMLDNRVGGNRAGAFIASGQINHNWQNGRRTSATVTLDNLDGEYDYNFNSVWFGQEIALDEGLLLSDGQTEFYIQQGVFLIETPTETIQPANRTITYNLVDKSAALDGTLGGNLESTYQVTQGTNIFEPIAAILAENKGNGYPVDRVTPVFTEYYNDKTQELPDGTTALMVDAPYTLTIDGTDGTIWSVVSGLAAMVNGWVGYDETGALRIDPSQDDILDTEKPVEWEFSMGEAELLGMTYTVKNSEVYNDYIVVGEAIIAGTQPGGRAQILDPRSPVDINAIGRKTLRVSQVGFGTNTQCEDYAVWQVKRSAVLQRAVNISCSQILHIHGNDLVSIVRTDKNGNPTERHLVQGFSRPLASTGEMTISAVSVNDFPVASVVRRGVIYAVPSQMGSLSYTGSYQTPTWENFDAAQLTQSGDLGGTQVGTYATTFTPKAGYIWWDGTSAAKTGDWQIWKQSVPIPAQSVPLVFNDTTQDVTFTGYDDTIMSVSGATSGLHAGSYTATFSLLDTNDYQWSDATTADKAVVWTIQQQALAFPTITGSYVYDGSEQTVSFSGYDIWLMEQSGTLSATNAGSYTATISLKYTGNFKWVDGTITPKNYVWTIEKAAPTYTAPTAKSLIYNGTTNTDGTAQALLNAGSATGGTIYYSEDQSAWSVNVPTKINAGTYTVYWKLTGDSNHTSVAVQSISVTIARKGITRVTAGAPYTYDGTSKTPAVNNYDSNTATQSGTSSATNAGSYISYYTPKSNFQWSSGGSTTSAIQITWTIKKAQAQISQFHPSAPITLSHDQSQLVDVEFVGDGKLRVVSEQPQIAYITSIKNSRFTVQGVGAGSTALAVSIGEGTNYSQSATYYYRIWVSA